MFTTTSLSIALADKGAPAPELLALEWRFDNALVGMSAREAASHIIAVAAGACPHELAARIPFLVCTRPECA